MLCSSGQGNLHPWTRSTPWCCAIHSWCCRHQRYDVLHGISYLPYLRLEKEFLVRKDRSCRWCRPIPCISFGYPLLSTLARRLKYKRPLDRQTLLNWSSNGRTYLSEAIWKNHEFGYRMAPGQWSIISVATIFASILLSRSWLPLASFFGAGRDGTAVLDTVLMICSSWSAGCFWLDWMSHLESVSLSGCANISYSNCHNSIQGIRIWWDTHHRALSTENNNSIQGKEDRISGNIDAESCKVLLCHPDHVLSLHVTYQVIDSGTILQDLYSSSLPYIYICRCRDLYQLGDRWIITDYLPMYTHWGQLE